MTTPLRCLVCGTDLVEGVCPNENHPASRDAHRWLALDLPDAPAGAQ